MRRALKASLQGRDASQLPVALLDLTKVGAAPWALRRASPRPHSLAPHARPGSGVGGLGLRLQDLAAPIHAAFQVDVVRAAQFARILIFHISRGFERVGRAAHAAARGRGFASGDGHRGNSKRKRAQQGPEIQARLVHAIQRGRQSP